MPVQSFHFQDASQKDLQRSIRTRSWMLAAAAVVTASVYLLNLMSIQIVDGETYHAQTESTTVSVIPIRAARGEIYDRDGQPLAENQTGLNIVFYYAFFDLENCAEQIGLLINLCEEQGESWYDPLPLNEDGTEFTGDEQDADTLRQALGLSSYATAADCMYNLCQEYGIIKGDDLTRRKIAGVCYGMQLRQFSLLNNEYTFAENVSVQTALQLKELSVRFPGMDIVEEDVRSYPDGTIAPHIIGTVGQMSAEEWSRYQPEGYQMSDYVGKFGIERYCEETLRGTDGTRTVEQGKNGEIISEEVSSQPESGNSVYLTIDAAFQKRVEEILSNYIEQLQQTGDLDEGGNVKGGAISVIDPKTGAVLALVTWPTYDINDYYSDYTTLLETENTPLVDRATDGLYRPGSTFKTVVAVAALEEGIITPEDTVNCTGVYTYFDQVIEGNTFHPTCLGIHGKLSVSEALTRSCNIFFYDVGRRLGIDTINRYASLMGLGEETGLELGSAIGTLSSPEHTKQMGGTWTQGNVVQASIGQMDTVVSPLQLAVQAMTLANRGDRYKVYLVDEVRSFDGSELIQKTEPERMSSFDMSEETFDAVVNGMIGVGLQYTAPEYMLSDLGYSVAVKTGTPQVTTDTTNSCAIAFAPAEDAEIAIGIMLEEGTGASRLIRDILCAWEEYVR